MRCRTKNHVTTRNPCRISGIFICAIDCVLHFYIIFCHNWIQMLLRGTIEIGSSYGLVVKCVNSPKLIIEMDSVVDGHGLCQNQYICLIEKRYQQTKWTSSYSMTRKIATFNIKLTFKYNVSDACLLFVVCKCDNLIGFAHHSPIW